MRGTVVEREWIGKLLAADATLGAGPSTGPDPDLPFRDDLLDAQGLRKRARETGASVALAERGAAATDLAARAAEDGRRLRGAYGEVLAAQQAERQITSAGRWLLDNFHLIDEQLDAIAQAAPGLRAVLPTLAAGPYAGLPRVWLLARDYVAHTDSRFDLASLQAFLLGFQETAPLTLAELWALPLALRSVLVENLRRIAVRVQDSLVARRQAEALAGGLIRADGAAPRPTGFDPSLPGPGARGPFLMQLARELQKLGPEAAAARAWLEQTMARHRLSVDELAQREHVRQGANNVSISHAITSLREIGALDWRDFVERVSLVEAELRRVAGYAALDFLTRDRYRRALAELAAGAGRPEFEIARVVVELALESPAPHELGTFLLTLAGRVQVERRCGYRPTFGQRVRRRIQRHAMPLYLGSLAFVTAGLLATVAFAAGLPAPALALLLPLALFPASDIAVALVNHLVQKAYPPRHLPRLELGDGVPATLRTLVVVPVLLSDRATLEAHLEQLEVHSLANPDRELFFALLADWRDASAVEVEGEAALLDGVAPLLRAMNARTPSGVETPRFLVLVRRRVWCASESCYMGWERKRGKLWELNRLLRGARDTSYLPELQGAAVPEGVRYVITLDADTRVPPGALRRLVGTAAHPLNQPQTDRQGIVRQGYGMLQPRVTPLLPVREEHSIYRDIVSGASGLDPYASAVSDVYQDLFGEGSFTGKGLYEVDVFMGALRERLPPGQVLSHDLLEGLHARCALVSDVEFFEEFPSHSEVAASRMHRWTRGDWQLLQWLVGARRRMLGALAGWKLLDNLRRSLSAPAALLLSIAAAAIAFRTPWLWWTLVILSLLMPALLHLADGLVRCARRRTSLAVVGADFGRDVRAAAMHLAMLAQNAALMLDAIARALYRLLFSRRRLLEWVTAAQARAAAGYRLPDFVWPLRSASLVVTITVLLLLLTYPARLVMLAPLLLLWWLAPVIARALSLPRPESRPADLLAPGARQELRLVARSTWRFFETFVTAEDRHLPPDNFQEDPAPVVAHRTSPTNIGLYLLAVVNAREFGWLGLGGAARRLADTFGTLRELPRYRGHLYNWYDTRTGAVLEPPYVSTVDSGNFAGDLLALRQFCMQQERRPLLPDDAPAALRDAWWVVQREFLALEAAGSQGGVVARAQLARAIESLRPADDPPAKGLQPVVQLRAMEAGSRELEDLLAVWEPARGERGRALHEAVAAYRRDVVSLAADLGSLLPACWRAAGQADEGPLDESLAALLATPLGELPAASRAVATRPEAHAVADALGQGAMAAQSLLQELRELADEAERMVVAMDFRFLYDEDRQLFSIGYRERDAELDASRYDLLASEARLASLVAIAKGDVPAEHWFRLGRRTGHTSAGDVLLSWSGSMFEYLMPSLVMEEPAGSLLDYTLARIVREQIAYGARHGVPWGVSESALNLRDRDATYQYSAFGVPGLGLKAGLSSNLVIAPYATALAAWHAPLAAVANFQALERIGARGPYGFREAVDFTPARLVPGQKFAIVNAYMAHHQGMTLAALANVLLGAPLRAWLHSDPRIQAVELLLQERPGRAPAPRVLPDQVEDPLAGPQVEADPSRELSGAALSRDAMQLLGNRHFATLVTGWGAGYSTFEGKALTRWKGDAGGERQGTFFHLCLVGEGATRPWSSTFEPVLTPAARWHASLADHEAAFTREEQGIETLLRIAVSPADNVELRRLRITNRRPTAVRLRVTTCCEVVLAPFAADRAHPAFSKLFVQTEEEGGCLLAHRRPRSDDERTLWMGQLLTASDAPPGTISFETDRARFIGRGRDASAPIAVLDREQMQRTTGTVLDPVFAFQVEIELRPGGCCLLQLTTAAGEDRATVLRQLRSNGGSDDYERIRTLAWTAARADLHHLQVGAVEARQYQALAGFLLRPAPQLRLSADLLGANQRGQPGLWRFGISGDRPIVALRCERAQDAELVRVLLRGQEYLRSKWLVFDVVILVESAHSYSQDALQAFNDVVQMERPFGGAEARPARGDCHILRREDISAEEFTLVLAAASVVLFASHGSLHEQLRLPRVVESRPPRAARSPAPGTALAPAALEFGNGLGGFVDDGREYQITLGPDQETPAPWCNVIANELAGCIVSERGSCSSWSANSRENRLTPWSNDPVSDPTGEALYLRDDDSGASWSPTAAPIRVPGATYVVSHGQGYSRFLALIDGIESELTVFVPPGQPARLMGLTLTNRSGRPRRLTLAAYAEWVLGDDRTKHGMHVQTEWDAQCGALLARNPWNTEFAGRVAFADLGGLQQSWTANRREFLGGATHLAAPEALQLQRPLSGATGAGIDPCAALQMAIELAPDASADAVFVLGQCATLQAARATVRQLREKSWRHWLGATRGEWEGRLARFAVRTPDRALDLLVNRWLPYQAIACRFWARAAFYQSGGAYGFRDQLQDCLLVMNYEPALAREHLLRAAGRQFEAGDVQHWWHPPSGRGVRTHFSDDRLWLPFVLCEYLDRTGDDRLLDETAPFIAGPEPAPGHEDAHYQPETLQRVATVYEHAALTIEASLAVGAHGLPLIGCGDWNDGMNRVGKDGRGESVWLGWFQSVVLRRFAAVAHGRGEHERAQRWEEHARAIVRAIEVEAWDGAWYRRAWFDDGTPLGASAAAECRIDAIAQSWSVFSGMGDRQRARTAMQSVDAQLVQPETGLLLLLAPPFDHLPQDPGYIKGYPPGLRENGGQYTHAAAWTAMAAALVGEPERAGGYLAALNPVRRTASRRGAVRYRIEPYVLAGDVYSTAPHAGRGGWSWYTGAAAWYWRAVVECLLGVRIGAESLSVTPHLPPSWTHCGLRLAALPGDGTEEIRYAIDFERTGAVTATVALLDGEPVDLTAVPLRADGREHVLQVRLPVATGDGEG